MRCVKWLSFLFIVALIAILVPFSVSAASPSIDDIKVYQGYTEVGDWIFVCTYNISGGNKSDCTNTSCFDINTYPWKIQLLFDTTVITDNSIEQGGMKPFGIYRSANEATTMSWGSTNYSIKIYGNWGAIPNSSRSLTAADWKGTNLKYLDAWVIQQAQIMETYDAKTYTESVAYYQTVLNVNGGNIFDIGIPYLSTYRPDIFIVTLDKVTINYNPTNSSKVYEAGLYNNWDIALGPDVSGALDSAAPYFGFTGADRGRMVGALLTFMGFISLALISKTISFLIIIGGVVIGLFPMSLVFVIVFILLVVLVRSLFWSST